MKKFLSLLTINTLSTNVLPTVNLVLNTSVIKNLTLKNNPIVSHNLFTKHVNTTTESINLIVIALNEIIYHGGSNGICKSTDATKTNLPQVSNHILKNTINLINNVTYIITNNNPYCYLHKSTNNANFNKIVLNQVVDFDDNTYIYLILQQDSWKLQGTDIDDESLQELSEELNVRVFWTDSIQKQKAIICLRDYQKFINQNKNKWFKQVSDIASRGIATHKQMQKIKQYLNNLDFSDYLQHVTWKPTTGLGKNNNYKQFIKLNKLQTDIINWVNQNMTKINQKYQDALQEAESDINMHGYSLQKVLNGKLLPQTIFEIDNFADKQSFHDFLQNQANKLFFKYKLRIWISVSSFSLFIVTIMLFLIFYWVFSAKYNPSKSAFKKWNKLYYQPKKNKNIKRNYW